MPPPVWGEASQVSEPQVRAGSEINHMADAENQALRAMVVLSSLEHSLSQDLG